MKFVLTNDDGIDAPGLQALAAAAAPLGSESIVVAQVDHHSGCSHKVTTDHPFRVIQTGPERFAVAGTPADCVRVALHRVAPDLAWVLSGINEGGNLGADVWHSGTVAAVREGVLHGRPGIAFSQYRKRGRSIDWGIASRWVSPIIRDLTATAWKQGTFWNVNLPHLDPDEADPEVVFCRVDPTPLPLGFREEGDLLHYNGDYHQRSRVPGADVDICFGGKIAVSLVSLF